MIGVFIDPRRTNTSIIFKAMDDIGVVMTPFGDVVTVILVANSYVAKGNDKN